MAGPYIVTTKRPAQSNWARRPRESGPRDSLHLDHGPILSHHRSPPRVRERADRAAGLHMAASTEPKSEILDAYNAQQEHPGHRESIA